MVVKRMATTGLHRKILHEGINIPLCLAPMVGLSHVSLRALVRSYMPREVLTIWPTEMLNSRRIPHEKLGETLETKKESGEAGLVPQILGNEEQEIAQSLIKLEKWGAEGIDINMGCPVKKALKHNYGVSLMGDAKYAAEVVGMAVKNTNLPVSVKLRAGKQGDVEFLTEFCQGLVSSGAAWLTLHPRTAEQKRRGKADWEQIKKLRISVDVPVIGNGDIQVLDDVYRMLEETQCDMVMAGRALTARPWMMWQLAEDLGFSAPEGRKGESAPRTALEEGVEFGRAQLFFLRSLREHFPENQAMRRFKFFVVNSHQWLEFGHAYFKALQKSKDLQQAEAVIEDFFSRPQKLNARTQLRY